MNYALVSFTCALLVFSFIFLFFYPFAPSHYADEFILYLLRALLIFVAATLLYRQVMHHSFFETLTVAMYILLNNLGISYAYSHREVLVQMEERGGMPALALLHIYSLLNVVVVVWIIVVRCKCCSSANGGRAEVEEMEKGNKLL